MTLQRQLLIMILVLFTFIFVGSFGISLYVNRSYIDEQLRTHARDAATSLGLILTQQAPQNDLGIMTAMIDAVYDRGYYQAITLVNNNNKALVIREKAIKIDRVPPWFVDFINFKMPSEEALIMSGWQQYGKVRVTSHPGYAYQELWANTYITFSFFTLLALIAFSLGIVAIHHLLRPLRAISRQALAIANGEFPIQKDLPRTVQLRQVVETMNYMTKKLEGMFEDQRQVTLQLRKKVYQDPITQLFNKVYFSNHIENEITSAVDEINAAVIMIEIQGMKEYNAVHGSSAGDELLLGVSRELLTLKESIHDFCLARLTGAAFGIAILHTTSVETTEFIQKIKEKLDLFISKYSHEKFDIKYNIGAQIVTSKLTPNEIFSALEVALSSAIRSGENKFDVEGAKPKETHPEVKWREVLEYILKNESVKVFIQPAYDREHHVMFYEARLRGLDRLGGLHSSKIIYAMADRTDLSHELDKMMVKRALKMIRTDRIDSPRIVLNLSSGSLNRQSFMMWLLYILTDYKHHAKKLTFEISEYVTVRNLEIIRRLINDVIPLGVKIAFDEFGGTSSNFSYLKSMKVAYVKLDGSLVKKIDSNSDNQFYVQSLVGIAHSIDIPVIVDGVVSESEFKTLDKLGVDGFQGNYFGELTLLELD